MFIQEMACIEVLLNHLINNTDLNQEIFTDFSSTKTFENKKSNLFNIISINKLIANYHEPSPFDLVRFVESGTIKGLYDKPTNTPIMDIPAQKDPTGFIKYIVEALKEENYILDEENTVYISSGQLEASLPQAWLYRLAEGYKRKNFSQLYLYNKHENFDISDSVSLIDYLRQTKTFLVSLSSENRDDYDIAFAKAEALTNHETKKQSVVKVEELIKKFQNNLPRGIKSKIERYKISDLFFIVKKAEEMGQEFYAKSLDEQKEYINRWFLDYINSNERTIESAQEYLLLKEDNNNKKDIITGLINLYFSLLKAQDMEFDGISLTDFKIETYLPPNLQRTLEDKQILRKAINRIGEEKAHVKSQIDMYNKQLDTLNITDEQFRDIKDRIVTLTEKYNIIEREEVEYQKTSNYLQERTKEEQKGSILDISFANNEIMKLLIAATEEGRVYLNKNGAQVTFELYNSKIGKTTFKTTISIKDLLTLIENIDYSLKENFKNNRY